MIVLSILHIMQYIIYLQYLFAQVSCDRNVVKKRAQVTNNSIFLILTNFSYIFFSIDDCFTGQYKIVCEHGKEGWDKKISILFDGMDE